MKIHVRQLSFDGEHWWDVQDPNWIVDVDESKICRKTDELEEQTTIDKEVTDKEDFDPSV